MTIDTGIIESQGQQAEGSSADDLRASLTSSLREIQERARDEQGRFAREQAAAAPAAEGQAPAPAAAAVDPAPSAQASAQAPAPAAAQHRAPDSWSPAAKAQFGALPPDVQAEIARREEEVHKGFTKHDEQRVFGKQVSDVISPYLPMIRAEGGSPVAAVQDLLQTAYMLRTAGQEQKQQMLIGLAQQFGIDIQQVSQRVLGGQVPQVDPQVQQLQRQLAELQQAQRSQQMATETAEQAQISQTIGAFSADPANVYFSNVRAEMAALLQGGRAKDLREAYDMACWARPDIRPLLLQQQAKQQQDEARARAAKARAAGVSVSGSPSGSVAPATVDANASLRDTLRAAYRSAVSDNAL